ncbi:uncharacterized protein LOC143473617 isoform X2 [Brachyhypopomus gauderio]|uniref:uncharacterized protein LOC143473617 isoform X2 n=1 Tax=Brachyhypopomus gauderio TaxID=698409 RepID=UPI004041325E
MSKQLRMTAEELPAEGRDVSAPSVKSKQAKKDFSPCGNFVSTSGTNPAVLTEEHWQELRNSLPCNMKMEDFIDVLENISAWVKVAVKEVVAPGFESGLLGVRSSAGICISSSPHEVEHGKTHDSESWCRFDVASRSSTSSLPEPLGVIFDISKDKIFSLIHGEVTRAIMNMLPPETKRYLNMKETISVMSAIVDDSLKQSGIVRSFVKTATEKLLQQCLGLKTCTKPDTASFFEHYCFGSPSVREADLEVRQSQQRCCFELSAVIAHTVISDLTGITTSQSEQDHTGSALQKKKSSCRWFRFPRFLKLRFKKWTKKVRFHTEDQVVDKHIPDAPSTSDKTIPKIRRKSLRTRLATAFTKICRKSGESPT